MSDESHLTASPVMEASPHPAAPDGELQFDQVEPVEGAAAQLHCNSCKQPIADAYWEMNGQPTCAACCAALTQHFTSAISWGTWGRVLLRGGGAALLGTIIYFAVLKLTGYELGLIAVAVGYLVGSGVHKAANFRGGWKLQAVAMALTYASIVSAYMPAVYKGLAENQQGKSAAPTADKTPAATGAVSPSTTTKPGSPAAAVLPADEKTLAATPAATTSATVAPASATTPSELSIGKALGQLFLAVMVIFFLSCIAPFWAGFENIMGLIIIGIALYEAWKLNRRVALVINGPFPAPAVATAPQPG